MASYGDYFCPAFCLAGEFRGAAVKNQLMRWFNCLRTGRGCSFYTNWCDYIELNIFGFSKNRVKN